MSEISFTDLRCHYQTGRSYVASGEGRNRVYGYRNGIQCDLGDIEQAEWCQRSWVWPGPVYVWQIGVNEMAGHC